MFRPLHQFRKCRQLESIILGGQCQISDYVKKGFNIYHYALIHKLKCANHHLERLEITLKTSSASEVLSASSDFMFAVNLSIDGYFYSCGSALDILAREVLVYFGETLPPIVYFKTASEILTNNRPGDTLLSKIAEPSWKGEFSNYRNALTHEIIVALKYTIDVQRSGDAEERRIILPLPDDPRIEPPLRTYERNRDVLKYVKENFKRILSLINQIYEEIYRRTISSGRLPL